MTQPRIPERDTHPAGAPLVEPPRGEPIRPSPMGAEPMGAEPMGAEPMGAEPMGAEPMGAEPASIEALLAWVHEPLVAAARGRARRDGLFGRRVRITARPALPIPEHATVVRGGEVRTLQQWPAIPDGLQAGDHVVVQVGTLPEDRERYVRWLHALARHDLPRISIAPCSRTASGLHPLWCIAAARLCLPAHVAIEARHDLLGIRLAQVALGFGADTIAGPIEPDRNLPLCGVTRPDENTTSGLATLVRHAGLSPAHDPEPTR